MLRCWGRVTTWAFTCSRRARAEFEGNAAGPDERYRNVGRRYFAVPQGGLSLALAPRWTIGFTAFAAGLGPDYPDSPYARFGGAERANLFLNSAGVATALAYKLDERHAIGVSLNLGYQSLSVEGLGFLSQVSSAPDKVSNQGKDGSISAGFTVGWRGQVTPELILAAAYRSKSWTGKHREYRGLIPDGGQLELPAIYGAGLLYTPHPDWTLGFDFQRYEYESEGGFGNRLIALMPPDRLLGDPDGAGFGFANHNVYKFGVAWKATPNWTLRAGYIDTNEMIRSSDTLFSLFGPATSSEHYTLGFTWAPGGPWELSGFAVHAPYQQVKGRNSVPAAFGGGEANVGVEVTGGGLSLGVRF